MAVATFDQLRATGGVVSEGRVKLAKSLGQKNLFLSHSQNDSAHVAPALGLLEQHGASVYVDVRDGGIAHLEPAEIARRLREAVTRCGRLVVLVTEATSTSRWIPWEMGLADGSAGTSQVALLPLRSSGGSELWVKQEYFELYSRIEYVLLQGQTAHCWAVRDPADGLYWALTQWMLMTDPPARR